MKASTMHFAKKVFLVLAAVCFVAGVVAPGCSSKSEPEYSITSDFSDIKWPNTELVKQIPEPESKYGEIVSESSSSFDVYIGNTDKGQFDAYVDACMEKGFTVDYSKSAMSFSAKNEAGYDLSIYHSDDDNYMNISLDDPSVSAKRAEEAASSSSSSASAASSSSSAQASAEPVSTDGIRPEFKSAIDSYEKFFNDYCEFMKKYSEAGNPVSMLADYTKFMAQYEETMSKLEALDDQELSPQEEKYYIDAMTRINQNLSNTASAM